jgi:3-phenylpropionate/trans-cinnamate dioxygenase ferredoxin reductase subunit
MGSTSRTVVIVGAGLAGIRTAEQLREGGFEGHITILGAEAHAPYDRPPLSKGALKNPSPLPPSLIDADRIAELNIDLRLGVAAQSLDTQAKKVLLANGEALAYDSLVISTGAHAKRLGSMALPPEVQVLRTFDDAAKLSAALATSGRLVVIGAGFIGCEVAATATDMGFQVSLIEAAPTPLYLPAGEIVGAEVASWHLSHGVDLRCDTKLVRFIGEDHLQGVELSTGEVIEASAVVLGLGAAPTTGWLADSGLDITDGVLCDASGKTAVADVYALGDVARWAPAGRQEHWTSAISQSRVVAENIIHDGTLTLTDADALPYFWSDMYGLKLQAVGSTGLGFQTKTLRLGPDKDRLVVLYGTKGKFVGVVAASLPRVVNRSRAIIVEGAGFAEAYEALSAI